MIHLVNFCMHALSAIHKHSFFFLNLISLHFSSSSCSSYFLPSKMTFKIFFILYFVYTMLVFVGLKNIVNMRKKFVVLHMLFWHSYMFLAHITTEIFFATYYFIFILFFLSNSALLLLCRHVEAPFCCFVVCCKE